MAMSPALAQEFSSSVYECKFVNALTNPKTLLLKDYFDSQLGQRMGKIDQTPASVLQIPLWDAQILIQIWYATNLRVDAQLPMSGTATSFPAVYHKGALQQDLFCTTLVN
jgi:hypothetical protein